MSIPLFSFSDGSQISRHCVSLWIQLFLSIFVTCPLAAAQMSDQLNLSVTISNGHSRDFQTCIPITVNEPINISWNKGEVRGGMELKLVRESNGEYLLSFAAHHWISKTSNSRQRWPALPLKLETPFGFGPIGGIVRPRSVLLSHWSCPGDLYGKSGPG